MLLAIDVGNTNTVFALIKDDKVYHEWRVASDGQRTCDEYFVWFHQLMQYHVIELKTVTSVIIASVVPQVNRALVHFSKNYLCVEPVLIGGQ